jgi:threonine synthase
MSFLTHLECSRCGKRHEAGQPHNLCACGGPLLARYDLAAAAKACPRDALAHGPASMWRYRALLPCRRDDSIVTLGEGFTPMVHARRLGERFQAPRLFIKDEGLNPTGTFKARGLACAVSMARELGLGRLAIPSAGNAASALAAYAAAAGIEAHIFMPADVPQANLVECRSFGACVNLVRGLISDCARAVAERAPQEGWFDVSTMKEPYRVEGKKTMGYEVAEQFGWKLPDAIFYPTGGGVGLIGMWKAFEEMEQLGWIARGPRPKMIAVQAAGCQPVVRAFEQGAASAEFFQGAETLAAGLRVPKPLADSLILEIVRASRGTCLAVTDEEILEGVREMSAAEGILAAPEGAACLPAYRKLLASGFLKPEETVVLFNTGSGLKYLDVLSRPPAPAGRRTEENIGGLITPY